MSEPKQKKPAFQMSTAAREARALMYQNRGRIALGLLLMLVSRGAGLVLPWTSKPFIDDVVGHHHVERLLPIVSLVLAATIVQALTSFALSQLLGVAGQRMIAERRKQVLRHITRLPIRYFDSTQSGVLNSRVMNDADGIRNLVGTGLVQMTGGIVTATAAVVILLRINAVLTVSLVGVLAVFGAGMTVAFQKLRPLFRERSKIQGEISGRLNETFGGIRVVKAYTAERREYIVFAKGIHRLFRNVARSLTGVSATMTFSGIVVGVVGAIVMYVGGRAMVAQHMTVGDWFKFV